MSPRTRTQPKGVEVIALPNVVEPEKPKIHASSVYEARRQGSTLILTEERLHQLLTDPRFIQKIENTSAYKEKGYTSFWTEIQGTERETGYYRIMPAGTQGEDRFQFVSGDYHEALKKVPKEELAHFFKGSNYLSVIVWRPGVNVGRVGVNGDDRLDDAASVVVVEQAQAGSTVVENALRYGTTEVRNVLSNHIKEVSGGPTAISIALRIDNEELRVLVAEALRNRRNS